MTEPEKIADLPEGLLQVVEPPRELQRALANSERSTPCGMPYVMFWRAGPKKGLPVSVYCYSATMAPDGSEGCVQTGKCVGPRFIPHIDQYTSPDPEDPNRRLRRLDAPEAVAAAKEAAKKSASATGVPDRRSDKEIAELIGLVWQKTIASIRGPGDWHP